MNHFLVLSEGYEADTIHGIFNELNEAKEFVENKFGNKFSKPEIQEWHNTEEIKRFILKGSFNWIEIK